jgi:ribulose-phosphate 3-epimerase
VINPGTPASSLEYALHLADLVLVMTVNPGYSGQEFIPEMCSKIGQVNHMVLARQLSTIIQVDGGITNHTLPQTYQAGARAFVAATAIFKHPQGIAAGVGELRQSVRAV